MITIKELREACEKAEKELGPDFCPYFVTKSKSMDGSDCITAHPIHHVNVIGEELVLSNVDIKESDISIGGHDDIPARRTKLTFDEVLKDCDYKENFKISPGCRTANKGFFTICRVDRTTIPEGYYAYDIRYGSGGGFCTIEPTVFADHAGTFITKKPIKMNKDGYKSLAGRGGYAFI